MKNKFSTLCCGCGIATALVLFTTPTIEGAVKERAYTFDAPGAVAGQQPPVITAFGRRGTEDSAPSTTDFGGVDPPDNGNNSFLPLIGSGNVARIPIYASAAGRPGA